MKRNSGTFSLVIFFNRFFIMKIRWLGRRKTSKSENIDTRMVSFYVMMSNTSSCIHQLSNFSMENRQCIVIVGKRARPLQISRKMVPECMFLPSYPFNSNHILNYCS